MESEIFKSKNNEILIATYKMVPKNNKKQNN